MKMQRRFKQTTSLRDRLAEFVAGARSEAERAPGGADRCELAKTVHKAETAADIDRWANTPGPKRLRPAAAAEGTQPSAPELPAVDCPAEGQIPMKQPHQCSRSKGMPAESPASSSPGLTVHRS
jgi:hypothetical protein